MTTRDIPVEYVREPRILLRPVDRKSIQYAELRESIAEYGVVASVSVRPLEEPYYELVAGFHRLTISRDLGLKTIPATVTELTDTEALSLQLQENVCRVDASRTEIAKHLLRIQKEQPQLTLNGLARLAGKSTRWVKQQLQLLDLEPRIQSLIDRGDMPVMNAYELCKLPERSRPAFLEDAQLMGRDEFRALVREKLLTMRGRNHSLSREFEPYPYVRGIKEILEMRDRWPEAIDWVLHLDTPTLEKRRAEYKERKRLHE